jgi:hypothetical protein
MAKKSSKKSGSGKSSRRRAAKQETPTAAAAPVVDAPAAPRSPAHADVSARAHAIWIARGRPTPGTPLEDWLQAERELAAARR